MSLNVSQSKLHNMLLTCLKIEILEYSYLYPAFVQITRYWGDKELLSTCIAMAQQAKKRMHYVYHMHPETVINKTDDSICNLNKNMLLFNQNKNSQFYEVLNKNENWDFVASFLYTIENCIVADSFFVSIWPTILLCIFDNISIQNTLQPEKKKSKRNIVRNQRLQLNIKAYLCKTNKHLLIQT